FEAGEAGGRPELLGPALGAGSVGMARVAAGITGHGGEAFGPGHVSDVVHQSPGAVERGRAEIVRPPADDVAGSMAHTAADAFDAGIRSLALRGRGRHSLEVVVPA